MYMYILMGIILFCVGLVMLISPKTFFEITESWKSGSNDVREPSGLYIVSTRIGGVAFSVVGLACIFILFL